MFVSRRPTARLTVLLTLLIVGPACTRSDDNRLKLIAHRCGIVDPNYAENSPGAVEAAIRRGYWMIETDVRESKDGHLVVQHDPDFTDFYGDPRLVTDMTWDQIKQLRAEPGGSRPIEFHELAALCKGRMRLMMDTKPPSHPEAFYRSMEASLRENDLLDSAYFIGTEESRAWFKGKCRIGVDRDTLRRAGAAGEDVSKRYFLFEHGRTLDAEGVNLARKLGVPAVVSINIFHYDDTPDPMKGARADTERLLEQGVTYFQIDSVYDPFLLDAPTQTP